MTFRSYVFTSIILTSGIAVLISILNYLIPFFQSFQVFTWAALAFFFAISLIAGYIGFRALEKSPYGFVAGVNGIVFVKLILCVGFVLAYVLIVKPGDPNFIVSFFVLYVVYTVFIIRQVLNAQKKKVQQEKQLKNANG